MGQTQPPVLSPHLSRGVCSVLCMKHRSLIENKLCDHLIWHYCNMYAQRDKLGWQFISSLLSIFTCNQICVCIDIDRFLFNFELGIFGMYSLCIGVSLYSILASQNVLCLWKYVWFLNFKGIGSGRAAQMHRITEDLLWNSLSTTTRERAIGRWKLALEQLRYILLPEHHGTIRLLTHVLHWYFKCCPLIVFPKVQSNDCPVQKTWLLFNKR